MEGEKNLKWITRDDILFWKRYDDYILRTTKLMTRVCNECKGISNSESQHKCRLCIDAPELKICKKCWTEILGTNVNHEKTCGGTFERLPFMWGEQAIGQTLPDARLMMIGESFGEAKETLEHKAVDKKN